ncbi:MAG: hypothetical protein LBI79_08195, partial [Nitrososphaerota archaeon]|nr:hypothetical protein [Nitrososphaerota archaeon]
EPPTEVSSWAFVNLILSILGIILAATTSAYTLLKRKKQKDKPYSAKDDSETGQINPYDKQAKRCRDLWLVIAFVLGIAGVVVFLLTEDMSLQMGGVDRWTILNIAIFAVELLSIALVFKYTKNTRRHRKKSEAYPL